MIIIKTSGEKGNILEIRNELMIAKLVIYSQVYEVDTQYYDQGEIILKEEWVLECEIKETDLPQILKMIRKLHNYKLPKIIWWGFNASDEYSKWLLDKEKYKFNWE